jgi:hypothetical protein
LNRQDAKKTKTRSIQKFSRQGRHGRQEKQEMTWGKRAGIAGIAVCTHPSSLITHHQDRS